MQNRVQRPLLRGKANPVKPSKTELLPLKLCISDDDALGSSSLHTLIGRLPQLAIQNVSIRFAIKNWVGSHLWEVNVISDIKLEELVNGLQQQRIS